MIKEPVVILANGDYPSHPTPVQTIQETNCIICCDGAVSELEANELVPDIIIGDLDSIDPRNKRKYDDRTMHLPNQNENDLRKAIHLAESEGIKEATILGATGKRDDHSIANIFTLLQFPTSIKCTMITDHGCFSLAEGMTEFQSFIGQQVSLFSANPEIKITSTNLKYNLISTKLSTLYYGSLNESCGKYFTLNISHEKILVYQIFE